MPRLAELLEYLAQPGLEDIWVLLDIKVCRTSPFTQAHADAIQLDNNADDVMRLIGDTIRSVPPSPSRPWHKRIVLGCWAAKFLPLCSRYLPGFPISHIGFSTLIASHFFMVPNIALNMAQPMLMTPWGRHFIRRAQSDGRPVYAWTKVNEESRMRWDMRHGLDGVVTGDPKLFLEIRKSWHEGTKDSVTMTTWLDVLRYNFFCLIYAFLFQCWFGFQGKSLVKIREEEEEQ
jgi:hypothetical protein